MSVTVAALKERVTIETPSLPVADGDLGFTQTWTAIAHRIPASIVPTTARDQERVIAQTVRSSTNYTATLRYVPGVTTKARLVWHGRTNRTLAILGVDEQGPDLELTCLEAVT